MDHCFVEKNNLIVFIELKLISNLIFLTIKR